MGMIKVLSSTDIKELVTMKEAIDVVEEAYRDLSAGRVEMPLRTITDLGKEELTLFYKPSFIPSLGTVGIKLLSQYKQTAGPGNPTIQGIVILIDAGTNMIRAIVDGTYLTALRTGAATGVATRQLAREDASVLALFGAGAQGYTQFKAVCAVRKIKRVYIFDLNPEAIRRFIDFHKSCTDVEFCVGDDTDVLKEVDIICTVTNSKSPLFKSEVLKRGVHINAIGSYNPGMRELPEDLFTYASLVVDHKDSCFSESGDIIIPLSEGMLDLSHYKGEIGDVLTGKAKGRETEEETTVFKSVGIAIQDLATACYAYRKACGREIGNDIVI